MPAQLCFIWNSCDPRVC